MTTTTELKKLLFAMILKTPIWLVHLAANQSSVMSIPTYDDDDTLTYQHSGESPVRFTLTSALEFGKERHQSRDTKIEISDEVLVQSR